MTISKNCRRAALLGAVLSAVACDVASFAADPKPIFEQTWNVPASSTSISVASLLPTGVTIYSTPASNPPDSSAFVMTFANVAFTRRLGDDCASCQAQSGATTTKPAFVLAMGSSAALPTNVVGGALVGAMVNYSITNNLSFDPLRVNTVTANPQGYMVIVVRSGTQVLGRDSVNGATTAFPATSVLSRSIPVGTGAITAPIAVDLTLTSPVGDHNEFINANGTVNSSAAIANLRASNVQISVPNTSVANTADTLDLADLNASITDNVVGATFEMAIDNPWPVAGNLNVDFRTPTQTIAKSIGLPAAITPSAPQKRSVSLLASDIRQLFGNQVVLAMSGGVSSTTPLIVTPKQAISIANRLILTIHTGK